MKHTNFKLKARAFLTCIAFLAIAVFANAQKTTVTGVVKDAQTGDPILGASVLEKGTTNGIITNFDGEFKLNVLPTATLVIKYVGYQPIEVAVAGKQNLVIQLKEDAIAISEVMVIGYGTVKKNDATGSLTAIRPDKMNKGLTTNAQDMIMGKIAGVSVTTGGGTPGGGATIRIRGGSSLNASNDPLIVIDGLPMDNNGIKGVANPLSTINPNDIESFTVLKDASATAIYGSRASNGVIIITTKKGEKGSKLKVSYDANTSVGVINKTYEGLNGDQFRELVNKLFPGDPANPTTDNNDKAVRNLLGQSNTDWQKEIYRNAFSQEHNLTLSGSYKNLPYRVSANYTNQNGLIKTSNFERFTSSVSISPSFFKDHLKVNINAKGMLVKNRFADNGVIGAAASMDPTQPVMSTDTIHINRFGGYWEWYNLDQNGKFKGANNMATRNPVSTLKNKKDVSNAKSIIANADIDYKVHFFPDMRLHLNIGMDNSYGIQELFIPTTAASNTPYGRTGWDETYKTNEVLSFYGQYTKKLGAINFDAMAGYEWQHFYRKGQSDYRGLVRVDKNGNITTDETFDYHTHIKAADTEWATESYLVSLFGRANISLFDRYLFTATYRNDNSSRFNSGLKSATFPSFAFAWKAKEESFLKEINEISDLKVRLGYGATGQQDIGNDYPYIPVYTPNINGAFYQFGTEYVSTIRPEGYNKFIKWEECETYNAGLDIGFMSNRFTASFDYYRRTSTDLINDVYVSAGTNFSNKVLSNVGVLTNDGYELMLNAKPILKKDISWDISFNMAYNKNRIVKITSNERENGYIARGGTFQYDNLVIDSKGLPTTTFWLLEQKYDSNGKPIEENTLIDPSNPALGKYKDVDAFVDRTNDNKINDDDRYYGKKSTPDFIFGFSTKLIYKNFDFGFNLRANVGNYLYNAPAMGGSNMGANGVYNLGFLSNKPNSALFTNFQGISTKIALSDYYLENASFLRCDNITLGYSLKNVFKVISNARVFATVQNPFVFTKYSGLDPEMFGGIDNNIYPRPITTIVGLSLNF